MPTFIFYARPSSVVWQSPVLTTVPIIDDVIRPDIIQSPETTDFCMPSPPLDHQLRADPFSVLLSNNHPWSFNLPSPLVNSIGPLFFHDGPRDFHLDFLWRFRRPRFFFFCEKITTSSESTAEPHVAHLYGKYDFPVFPHIYIRLAHARFPTNTPYVETLRSIPTKTPPLPVRTFLPTRCTTITLLEHFFSFLPFFMSYFYRHTHHELPTVDHRQRRASLLFFRRFYSFVLSVILRMTPGRILLH